MHGQADYWSICARLIGRSRSWSEKSTPGTGRIRRASAYKRSLGSALSRQARWWRASGMRMRSTMLANSPPGLDSCRGRTLRVVRRSCSIISKRGDTYLRTLLIHGARSVLLSAKRHPDRASGWLARVASRRNPNIAAVALANKNARAVWALLAHGSHYQAGYHSANAMAA